MAWYGMLWYDTKTNAWDGDAFGRTYDDILATIAQKLLYLNFLTSRFHILTIILLLLLFK
jgi:hypothetical protein